MSSSSDEEYFDCNLEPIRYYAVACQRNKGSGLVTSDINEAKNKVKSTKGSRFKSFYNILEAKIFSESYLLDDADLLSEKKNKLPKVESDPFSNLSTSDLNNFKDCMEKCDVEKCQALIISNPRYLVTVCDLPTIFRLARFHYNALHIATAAKQPHIVRLILDTLTQESLWHTIYPTADDRCKKDRMNRVIDMYLNTPDFFKHETPLHFAAKYGCDESVRALLSQGLTDTSLKNQDNCRADEIICARYDGPAIDQKKAQIQNIFSEKYVVLLGGEKMRVLEPLSHCQLLALLRSSNDTYSATSPGSRGDICIYTDSCIVRAYIGPLPEIKAQQLRCRWSVLNAEDALRFEQTRRKDAEKGMECHGRYLAQLFDSSWKEYWPFLQCHVDLGDDEGLSKLEEHLLAAMGRDDQSRDMIDEMGSMSAIISDEVTERTEKDESRYHWAYASLVRLFSRMTLQTSRSSKDSALTAPLLPFKSPATVRHNHTPMVTSTPLAAKHRSVMDSLRSTRTPFNTSLLGQGLLTPTDRQVRQAVLANSHGRHARFPHVSSWLEDLSKVDPEHDPSQTALPNVSIITSTPLRQRPTTATNRLLYSSHCLSPLSKIALPD